MRVLQYSTLAPVRPHRLIQKRQSKIRAIKKAERLANIKLNLSILVLVICIIGAAWVDGGIR